MDCDLLIGAPQRYDIRNLAGPVVVKDNIELSELIFQGSINHAVLDGLRVPLFALRLFANVDATPVPGDDFVEIECTALVALGQFKQLVVDEEVTIGEMDNGRIE